MKKEDIITLVLQVIMVCLFIVLTAAYVVEAKWFEAICFFFCAITNIISLCLLIKK